jgi:hypothetical protein
MLIRIHSQAEKNITLFHSNRGHRKKPPKSRRFPHALVKICIFPAFFGQLRLRSLTVFAIVPSAQVFSPIFQGRRKKFAARPVFRDGKKSTGG